MSGAAQPPQIGKDSVSFANISATPTAFSLNAGRYALLTSSTGTGSITLQALSADGVTYISVMGAITTTTGATVLDLPAGQYQLAIVTFTAVYASLARVPRA